MMKLNNILFGILTLISFSLFSQNEEENGLASTNGVTEFQLKTNDIKDLESFDWSTINDLFKMNEDDQIIKLGFQYDNLSRKRKSKPNIKNLKFEVSGTTQELSELIEKSKNMVAKFLEINETYN